MTSDGGLPFRLPAAAFRDIAHLIDRSTALRDIVSRAESMVGKVPFEAYAESIAKETEVPDEAVRSAIKALQALRSIQQLLDIDATELVRRLDTTLETDADSDWKEQYWTRWAECKGTIASVLGTLTKDHPLVLLWKSETLRGAHQNVLGSSAILTDIRPIFDNCADTIVQTMVTQTLLIDYYAGSERRRVQFALDATDIAELQKACERAQKKSRVIKESLSSVSWPTSIPHEASDNT